MLAHTRKSTRGISQVTPLHSGKWRKFAGNKFHWACSKQGIGKRVEEPGLTEISQKVKNICNYNHNNSINYKFLKLLKLLELVLSSRTV
jgi:hypothetical protein